MKRTIIILFAFLPMLLHAGVILKHSGERLEDVTIKSVNDTEIVYELNGQEVSIPKTDVSAILYDDGRYVEIKVQKPTSLVDNSENSSIKYYDDDAEAKRLTKEQKAREEEEKRQQQEAAKAAALEEALAIEQTYQDGQIHRISSNSWYFIDKYYTKKEINSIILSCPDAKAKYDDGHKWMVAGWSGAAGSVALLIIGNSMMAADTRVWYENGHKYRYSGGVWTAGLPFMLLGVCGIPTCVTIASIGHYRMNNSYKIYNDLCAAKNESALSLNFGPTRDGLGLTILF